MADGTYGGTGGGQRENGDRLDRLIKATEAKTRAETRVGDLMEAILDIQSAGHAKLEVTGEQLRELCSRIGRLEAAVMSISEYLAALAGRDHTEVLEIRRRLLNGLAERPSHAVQIDQGVRFGDEAQVDVGGDMVGGDKGGE